MNENAPPTTSQQPPLITDAVLKRAVDSLNQKEPHGMRTDFDPEVTAAIKLYMEDFIDRAIRETARATNLRKSKKIQTKDVEFALRSDRQNEKAVNPIPSSE
ncbi:hypothetical protein M3Y99_01746500 [Aphelenchoides fujianensis]|nr:hypothetical protein M3Y99_01746500 [Aphelenchoides fujianensis]